MEWLIAAVVGIACGAIGGFACALLELNWRRAVNRARMRRGQPGLRNEILPRTWVPAGLAGAAVSAGLLRYGGLLVGGAAALLLPFAIWLLVRLAALVFRPR